ncbi:hypothetical protein [Cellulomonas fimi]|uniref:Uncharacterized protein n=1 Tax=Cellulomonas fimi (strain ATCC 484 / DSM 20113 / JCM 1341 / CCUG 24087 / LMG 16345 / NBRC 15513 / NCIMB 8980 / NCTC 7547 / NRS-133) TaxID=590998 RepID=F4H3T9_CELFA|nr:hypothetical protein [Cellulomonas fimi]AEE44163.1 hypothetical protein Celf_0011 [Cellulomonas fimi ATCC 484]NNH07572.1 hypothetical protein [Cellulomonas fimi]VEH25793.1 Uncharacterised protein [Cellulomonas fimi]
MLLADLQSRVRIALTNTLVDQWTLFAPSSGTSRPSPRTISFHLGWALRGMIERTWDVDAEYDRSGMVLESSVRLDEGTSRPPHLIVHRRGRLGPEHNLLLVELSADASGAPGSLDVDTAHAVQRRFGYRYGVLLDLRLAEEGTTARVTPHWRWTTLDDGPVTHAPQPVYSADVLAGITARARGGDAW